MGAVPAGGADVHEAAVGVGATVLVMVVAGKLLGWCGWVVWYVTGGMLCQG